MFILGIFFVYPIMIFAKVMVNNFDTAGFKSDIALSHDSNVLSSIGQIDPIDTLHNSRYLIPYLFLVILEVINIVHSVYLISLNPNLSFFERVYIKASMIPGLAVIFLPILYINKWLFRRNDWKIVIGVKLNKYFSISMSFIFLILTSSLLLWDSFQISNRMFNSVIPNLSFSTKPGEENLIEICVDSMDRIYTSPFFLNSSFKDFYYFTKFVTPGFFTAESEKIIYSENLLNDFWQTDWSQKSKYSWSEISNIDHWLDVTMSASKAKHISNSNHFNNIHLINDIPNRSVLNHNFDALNVTPNINYISNEMTKFDTVGRFGVTKNSQEKNNIEFIKNHMTISDGASRLMYSPITLHNPSRVDKYGNYSLFAGNNTNNSSYMNNYNIPAEWLMSIIGDLFNNMKSLSNEFGNVYDNSMIVIFGDHSSHSNLSPNLNTNVGDELLKNRSPLLIKFPHTRLNGTGPEVVDDVAVYAPFLSKIEEHYFDAHDDTLAWMRSNSNFNIDRKFISYAPWPLGGQGFISEFNGDKLESANSLSGSNIIFSDDSDKYIQEVLQEISWK